MADESHQKPEPSKPTRRGFGAALMLGWAALTACGGMLLLMLQQFLSPKATREPQRRWRVGKLEDFNQAGAAAGGGGGVYEQFKKTPDGAQGFWIVNLQPHEDKLVAVSTLCTHLGCIPNWQATDKIFKCPCHGSGFDIRGVNFEGPAPRPLERYAISLDPQGYVVVDQSTVFRQEMGQWANPDSFISLQ